MQPTQIMAGATIFAAGEPSNFVYIIESGLVSIVVNETEVARLGPGELFGESGVLEHRARSASAFAVTDTVLLETPAEAFLSAFGMNNDRALALVKMICKRLRDTNLRGVRHDSPALATAAEAVIRIVPDHPLLTGTYGVAPVPVSHLPFQVGNRYGGEARAIASNHSLTIQAHGRPELAAPHFEIARRDGRIGVHDLGTAKGTIINGRAVGKGAFEAFAPLHDGNNQIIAGGVDSPFRFRVTVLPGVVQRGG